MNTREFLIWGWQTDPFALAVGAALPIAYGLAFRFTSGKRIAYLATAVGIVLLALVSPIGVLAQYYLFSAHMVQHLLLLLIAPALLVLSLPPEDEVTAPMLFVPWLVGLLRAAPLSWLAGVGAMSLWHVPALCNAAAASQALRNVQTLSLLLAGIMFWWPVFGPNRQARLGPLTGIVYLFSACFACTLLGIYITFTPLNVCSIYHHPVDKFNVLSLVRNDWGISARLDQHLGGLMMWVPACLIYLGGIVGLLARWYGSEPSQVPSVLRPSPSRNEPVRPRAKPSFKEI